MSEHPHSIGSAELHGERGEEQGSTPLPSADRTKAEAVLTGEYAYLAGEIGRLYGVDLSQELTATTAASLMRNILTHEYASPEESLRAAELLNRFIEHLWNKGNYLFHSDDLQLDLNRLNGTRPQPYEFMQTLVSNAPVIGGVEPLLIRFPQNAVEADKPHTHPGGRIIAIHAGDATLNNAERNGEAMPTIRLPKNTIIFMPAGIVHNYAAAKGGDGVTVLPPKPVPVDAEGNASLKDFEAAANDGDALLVSIHVGYEDISKHDAISFVEEPNSQAIPDFTQTADDIERVMGAFGDHAALRNFQTLRAQSQLPGPNANKKLSR